MTTTIQKKRRLRSGGANGSASLLYFMTVFEYKIQWLVETYYVSIYAIFDPKTFINKYLIKHNFVDISTIVKVENEQQTPLILDKIEEGVKLVDRCARIATNT